MPPPAGSGQPEREDPGGALAERGHSGRRSYLARTTDAPGGGEPRRPGAPQSWRGVIGSVHPLGEGRKKVLLEFNDDNLRRLYTEPDFRLPSMGTNLMKQYRKKTGLLASAHDERDLRAMRSLHFEKLAGDRRGQNSIRLNDQYRLIFRLRTGGDGRVAVVIAVVDYH